MAVHYASVHDSNPSTLRIIALEVVTGSIRKGNILHRLLQREAFWISQLKSIIFAGLNEELDLTSYLLNYSSFMILVVIIVSLFGGM